MVGKQAGIKFQTGASELYFDRELSTGKQTYDTNKVEYPVTEPLQKIEANAQVTIPVLSSMSHYFWPAYIETNAPVW